MSASNLELLNSFREADGKAPFADWRKARHQPMLDAYMAAQIAETPTGEEDEEEGDEPDALLIDPVSGAMARESAVKAEDVAPTAEKLPAYKVLANKSGKKSTIEKPVEFIHAWLDENSDVTRKAAVATLVGFGVNYATARTQYQRWFKARKG
jgi:hypothetical protein